MIIGRMDTIKAPPFGAGAPLAAPLPRADLPVDSVDLRSAYPPAAPPRAAKAQQTAKAAPADSVHAVEVVRTAPSQYWDKIELLRDSNPNFKYEPYREKQKHTNAEVIEAFGRADPPSTDALLHYGKGWDTNPIKTPVLLIHGATKDAADWVEPKENAGNEPLGTTLARDGFKVFGITFSHDQGDNYYWAQQVANAVERIKEVTGSDKVDLVAHSKGAVPARMYASDFRKPWMTPYRGDVRDLVLLGGPQLGVDFAFRHPCINYALYPETSNSKLDAPMTWDKLLYFGSWHGTKELSLYGDGGDFFPGQRQLLHRWDDKYPVNPLEPDWYTSYNGGQGFVSRSRGIDYSIKESGNFIESLRAKGVQKDVRLFVLAGSHPDIPFIHNEHDGPSDGVVFIDSATCTKDMEREGAKVFGKGILPINHMELRSADSAKEWVEKALLNDDKAPPEELEKDFGLSLQSTIAQFELEHRDPGMTTASLGAASLGAASLGNTEGFLVAPQVKKLD